MMFPELDLASPWTSPQQHVEMRVLAGGVFVFGEDMALLFAVWKRLSKDNAGGERFKEKRR